MILLAIYLSTWKGRNDRIFKSKVRSYQEFELYFLENFVQLKSSFL